MCSGGAALQGRRAPQSPLQKVCTGKEHMDGNTTDDGTETAKPDTYIEEPPPFLGSWGRVYLAIAIYLVTVIALLGLFTRGLNR